MICDSKIFVLLSEGIVYKAGPIWRPFTFAKVTIRNQFQGKPSVYSYTSHTPPPFPSHMYRTHMYMPSNTKYYFKKEPTSHKEVARGHYEETVQGSRQTTGNRRGGSTADLQDRIQFKSPSQASSVQPKTYMF